MTKVVLAAGNILTPLGDLDATWQQMQAGVCGLRQTDAGLSTSYPLGLIEGLAGEWGSWTRLSGLLDRLLSDLPSLPPDTGLVVATTKGAVDEQLAAAGAKQGQPWQLAEYLRARLFLHGPAKTVSGACASGTIGAIQAAMALASGLCSHVLVVAVDLVARFTLTGFDSLKALSAAGPKPFDKQRSGLALSDGGAWLLLSRQDRIAELGLSPLAGLQSWGVSCDAVHITAPCRQGSGLKRILQKIVAEAGRPPGGINAHGTATVYNDAMELLAFHELFAGKVPVCSVKGALGHSLGAAGLVEILLSCRSLMHDCLPPTIGLQEPDRYGECASGTESLQLNIPTVLSCNSGFGGINAAVLLARNDEPGGGQW